jgi:hypothetical protein
MSKRNRETLTIAPGPVEAPRVPVVERIDLTHQVDSRMVVTPTMRATVDALGVRVGADLYPWANIRRVRYA